MLTANIPAQRGILACLYAAGIVDAGLWLVWDDERGYRWHITLTTINDYVQTLRLAALHVRQGEHGQRT